jgi:ParB family chromosome partitioning protein
MSERRPRGGLGRGLDALLGEIAQEAPIAGSTAAAAQGVRTLPVGSMAPHPGQPRRRFDEALLDELAASIAARGMIQPIVVRPHGHQYQIVAGERRWRAAQRARLHEVPVVVRDFDDAETLEIALVENIQRADLNAIEEAQAYQRLVGDYGHTQEALA